MKAWVEGLYFITENDALWEVTILPPESCELAYWVAQGFREEPWESFWKPLVERFSWYSTEEEDQADRYRQWVMAIEELGAEWFVVRKGKIEVTWMVVVQFMDGEVVGCKTTGVET